MVSDRLILALLIGSAGVVSACATGQAPDRASNASPDADAGWEDAAQDGADDASDSTDPQDGDSPVQDALPPCDANLLINEVQTAGSGGNRDEFVELHNPADCVLAVGGYALYYVDGDGTNELLVWSAVAGQTMQPGQFFALGGKDFAGGADFPMGSDVSLDESGGGLGLKFDDVLVDAVGWGEATHDYVESSPTVAPPVGKSIGRFPDDEDTNDNAADFAELSPSPRKTNNAW